MVGFWGYAGLSMVVSVGLLISWPFSVAQGKNVRYEQALIIGQQQERQLLSDMDAMKRLGVFDAETESPKSKDL